MKKRDNQYVKRSQKDYSAILNLNYYFNLSEIRVNFQIENCWRLLLFL